MVLDLKFISNPTPSILIIYELMWLILAIQPLLNSPRYKNTISRPIKMVEFYIHLWEWLKMHFFME